MSLVPSLLLALIPLFALIFIGYALKRWAKVLRVHHIPILNGLVLDVTLPATIFLAIAKAPAIPLSYALLPLLFVATQLCTLGLAFVLAQALKLPRTTKGMVLMTAAFGNTAFLGYPVAMAVMPKMFPAAVLLDEFGMVILMYVSASIITNAFGNTTSSDGEPLLWHRALLRFARGPIFISMLAGLAAHSLHGHVPQPLHIAVAPLLQIIGYLGQATTPLVLLALGAALRPREAASPILLLSGVLKLLVCPFLMWAIFRGFGLPPDLVRVGVLQASMPTSVLVSVLCGQYQMDGERAGGVVCATTALSILTIPLMQALLK